MLDDLQKRLGYFFKNKNLLIRALTHRSSMELNNERLEFLGDAILGYIITEELFHRHPEAREGILSRMRSSLVRGEYLVALAKQLDLGQYLQLGVGEIRQGGCNRASILADALEAVIGAIYLDGGIELCREVILQLYGSDIDTLSQATSKKDPKSVLQEWLQAHRLPLPHYELTVEGRAHEQLFYIVCYVKGLPYRAKGVSTNRRKAEQIAAAAFLEQLSDE